MMSIKGMRPEAVSHMLESEKRDEIVLLLREIRDAVVRMSPKPRVFEEIPEGKRQVG